MVAVPTCDVAAGAGDVFRDEGAPGLGGTAGFGVCLTGVAVACASLVETVRVSCPQPDATSAPHAPNRSTARINPTLAIGYRQHGLSRVAEAVGVSRPRRTRLAPRNGRKSLSVPT